LKIPDGLPTDEASIEAMATMDREISWHKLVVDLAKCNLQCAREFLQKVNVETELNLLETYKMKESEEKRNLRESMRQLEAANQRKIELLQECIVTANKEKELEVEVEKLKAVLENKRALIQEVKGISHRSFIHRPSKFVSDTADETVESDFRWMPCAVCEGPFPKKDIILAPCMCLYHPWCVVFQNWKSNSCARQSCKEVFGEAWQRSHGLFQIQGKAKLPIGVIESF
jgi:hypothetical protein